MRVSKRFPLAVHSLLFVAILSPARRVTSSLVAESADINPVTVRNIFLNLSENGMLTASAGKNGGFRLAKEPGDITLWDIYQAVETEDVEEIFSLNKTDSCSMVGETLHQVLHPHMESALNAMKAEMEKVTLEMLMSELMTSIKEVRTEEEIEAFIHKED